MQTPDRLVLTLRRIEEFLAILRLEDFGADAEGGKRVIDDLRFLHGELKAGRKTLPLPLHERRPLDVAFGQDGHFSAPFSELHDRAVDLLALFQAVTWPLLSWECEPLGGLIPKEAELWLLYRDLRAALLDRRLDNLMAPLQRGLEALSLGFGRDADSEFVEEKEFIRGLMAHPDYRAVSPLPGSAVIRPMFDGCRVRLLHPGEERHALAVWPWGALKMNYPIQCQFGLVDGRWMVVGYG